MGEEFDPLTTESAVKPISHKGILLIMAGVVAVGMIVGFLSAGTAFGFGVLFGGLLSFANYFWLARSTRAIFSETAMATTGILAAKYVLRYFAIGFVLLLVYLTGAVPMASVVLGLSAFAIAVVVQGLKNIFSSSI